MSDLSIYELFRDKMRSGDHISWDGDTLLGFMIKLFTVRNHSSLVFRPDEFAGLSNRRWIIEADEGEVNVRILSKKLSSYKGKAYWHPLKSEYDQYRPSMEEYLSACLGDKYDYRGLLANVFGYVKVNQDRLFCSELAGQCYMTAIPKMELVKLLPNDGISRLFEGDALRPGDVATLPIFEPEVRIL